MPIHGSRTKCRTLYWSQRRICRGQSLHAGCFQDSRPLLKSFISSGITFDMLGEVSPLRYRGRAWVPAIVKHVGVIRSPDLRHQQRLTSFEDNKMGFSCLCRLQGRKGGYKHGTVIKITAFAEEYREYRTASEQRSLL